MNSPVSLRIQSILYQIPVEHVAHSMECLARAVEIAKSNHILSRVEVALGDCSPEAVLDTAALERIKAYFAPLEVSFQYEVFGKNLGSAAGHNRLLESLHSEYVLILNPDTIVAPNLFVELFEPMGRDDMIGIVEARQSPIEHPKDYDPVTGETSWAATACALVRSDVVKEIRGFDADTFFLYCDDVDFSWRVRMAGYKVIFKPSAVIFHDKRLGQDGKWKVGAAEEYYSAEAALMMAHKWSRPGLVKLIEMYLSTGGSERQRSALEAFRKRRTAGTLPTPIDKDHEIGQFVEGFYARHRF